MTAILERLRIFTPLGIRFLDAATDRSVENGLEVCLRALGSSGRWRRAARSASGVYAFHGIAELRAVEYPADDESSIDSPAETQTFVVTVRDAQRRFVPVMFTESLPLPERGIYTGPLGAGSPPFAGSPPQNSSPGFYLFSAPSRMTSPGLAEVRANLVEYDPDVANPAKMRPAPHALVEIRHRGHSWFGLSDANGGLAVLFPYPALTTKLTGSPPAGKTPLHNQQWDLTIRIRYAPQKLDFIDELELPELRSIAAQAPASIYTSLPTSPISDNPTTEVSTTLHYGEVCVLRTDDEPVLCVEGPTSSP